MKIYLPIEITNENCAIVLDKDTVRVYDEVPTLNSTVSYTDYFINSHYLSKTSEEQFIDYIPTCSNYENYTTAFYHRNDFDSILTIFFIMLFICYFIFGKILHSFFIGFKH